MFLLATLLTLLHASIVLVNGDYVVTVTGTSYTNQAGRCATCPPQSTSESPDIPGCCDTPSGDCLSGDVCDTAFLYCLRPPTAPGMGVSGESNCSPVNPGTRTPGTAMDSNNVDFNRESVLGLSNPFNLTGISRQYMGVTLYIWVTDQDEDDVIDTIDEFFISITAPVNRTISSRQYTGVHSLARIELSYTVTCARYYYGTFCENFDACELNAVNCSGRGQCSNGEEGNTFSCECESGFTGDECERVDHCTNNGVDCEGNGACLNTQNSDNPTVCVCNEGFMGATCGQREGEVSNAVIIAASIGGGLVLILASILGVILIYVCYRYAPRPQPKRANIAAIHRREQRSRPTSSRTSDAGLYSQFRWSRFDPTQAPPMTTPTAYQHTVNINKEIPGYDPAPQNFSTRPPPETTKASTAPPSHTKTSDRAKKMEEEKKMIVEESEEEEEEEEEEETSSSEESEGDTVDEQPGRSEI